MRPPAIPMLDLAAQHSEIEEELLEGVAEVNASGRFILNDAVQTFESELAKLCDAPHSVSCNSGTDALWLALRQGACRPVLRSRPRRGRAGRCRRWRRCSRTTRGLTRPESGLPNKKPKVEQA